MTKADVGDVVTEDVLRERAMASLERQIARGDLVAVWRSYNDGEAYRLDKESGQWVVAVTHRNSGGGVVTRGFFE
jgi:hypothetical protein